MIPDAVQVSIRALRSVTRKHGTSCACHTTDHMYMGLKSGKPESAKSLLQQLQMKGKAINNNATTF